MDFSEALKALKMGNKVRRTGWNGKDMWVAISEILKNGDVVAVDDIRKVVEPFFFMGCATNTRRHIWIPSVSDLMANDWMLVI